MNRKKYLFFLIIVVFLIYTPSLFSGFVWLDHSQVMEEGLIIHDSEELYGSFFSPLMSKHGYYYRPLFKASLTLDYLIFKKNPFGYHLSNIFFHLFNTILIFFILTRFTSLGRAFLTTLIWALHPLGVFVVSHISARSDLIFSSFLLFGFNYHLKFRETGKNIYLIFSLIAFSLSLMSKETAIVYPIVILLYEILFIRQRAWHSILPSFLIGLLFFLFKLGITGKAGTRIPLLYGEPLTVFFTMTVVFLDYLKTIVFPLGLAMSDAFLKYESFHPLILISLITFGVFFLIAVKNLNRDRTMLFLLLWFFIMLIPTSNIIPALHFRAERFLYLPSLGIIYFLLNLFYILRLKFKPAETKGEDMANRPLNLFNKYNIEKSMLLIILLALGFINISRQLDFKDDVTLSRRVIEIAPHSKEAYQMLGLHYLNGNDYEEAIGYFNKALETNGRYFSYLHEYGVYNNLGVIYLRLNQIPRSISYFEKALTVSNEALGYLNLYFCYKVSGLEAEAEKHLAIARSLDPDLVKRYIK